MRRGEERIDIVALSAAKDEGLGQTFEFVREMNESSEAEVGYSRRGNDGSIGTLLDLILSKYNHYPSHHDQTVVAIFFLFIVCIENNKTSNPTRTTDNKPRLKSSGSKSNPFDGASRKKKTSGPP